MWKRCSTTRPIRSRRGSSSKSSPGTARAWIAWSTICCGSRGSTPTRNRSISRPARSSRSLSSVVSDLGLAIAAKQQHVTTSVAPEAGTISADPAKLHDIVRNLVENAVNYSPDRADIRVEALKRPDRARRHHRDRFRSRHSDVRPGPGVRALLPRRQGAVAAWRHGSWPCHRAASRRAARRHARPPRTGPRAGRALP